MRILIVGGAGLMSAGTARDLLSNLSSGVTKIIAADASADRLDALKKSLPDPRLETRLFDVNDRAALLSLLADCDLCINGVPTFAGFQMAIFEACLEARRPYVDYGGMGVYTVRQKAQHDKWKNAAQPPSSASAQIPDFPTSSVARLPIGWTALIASTCIGQRPRLARKAPYSYRLTAYLLFWRSTPTPANSFWTASCGKCLRKPELRLSIYPNLGDARPSSTRSIPNR